MLFDPFYCFTIYFGLLIVIGIIGKIIEHTIITKKESHQEIKKQESVQAIQDLIPSNPADVLKKAKKALEEKTKDLPYGQIYEAELLLKRIDKDAKEYPEAQLLLKNIQDLKKKQEAYDKRKIADEKKATRILYAPLLEKAFLDKGYDIYVTVEGKDANILKIKWILVSRPLVHKLCQDLNLMQKWREMGFKKVIFTDGFRNTWHLDL